MPKQAFQVCSYPGCTELVRSGYCEKHSTTINQSRQEPQLEHDPTHQRLYDRKWKRIRLMHLANNPWCETCLDHGIYTPAKEVHHVIPHRGDQQIFKTGPLQSLCHKCHSRITYREVNNPSDSYYPFIPGDYAVPVFMVCGAPGSGKNTFVNKTAQPGAVVVDLDLIITSMTGLPPYSPLTQDILNRAFHKRNAWLLDLYNHPGDTKSIWFIVSGGLTSDRRIWATILRPKMVYVLLPGKEECIRRIRADHRRAYVVFEQCQAVDRWYANYHPRDGEVVIRLGMEEGSTDR